MATASAKPETKLGPREAAQAALEYHRQLFNRLKVVGPTLEEVELSDDEKFWHITLGYTEVPQPQSGELPDFLSRPRQKFKIFKIDAQTGRVVSMKMRPPVE